jgi:hypothetical protein
MVDRGVLRMDVDRRRTMDVADAPLWPVGIPHGTMVLDPGTPLGARVGVLGRRTGLRELVPVRL